MADKLSWGVIGTGNIARKFATGLAKSKTGRLVAVGSRERETADRFGEEFGAPRRHGSYEALLADDAVQAVYISTPHPMHAEWAIRAAEAGKHILCEKPLAINGPQAMAIVEAAREHDVFLMEAFMYRCHPQTARLVELLRAKAVGEVRVIRAAFSFRAGFNAEGRLFKNALAGGGILDVGCYPVSMARLVAGVSAGGEFAEPIEVKGCAHLGQTGVDEWAVASLRFPGDLLASVATGVSVWQEPTVQIFGDEGVITVPDPWTPAREGGAVKILVRKHSGETREIVIDTKDYLYALEADTVAANLPKRQAAFPAMSWADTLGNLRALDLWRESIGLVYDEEKPAAVVPVHRRPLAVRKDAKMPYGRVAGVNLPASRLVHGCDFMASMPLAAVLLDDFFEHGGNCFDTAHIYGRGASEHLLGQWVRNRGLRDQVVILDKGAHTPFCTPEHLSAQHRESLDRLQMDRVDIYMMHRDNTQVPVGEFIDVLNEHLRAGTMRAIGASNWTLPRLREANEYARKNGLKGFTAVSNQLSLARMIEPPWDGCLSCKGPEWTAWLKESGVACMPWSSQARGFFTDRAGEDRRSDAEMVRCWYAEDNFERRRRAYELAGKRGVAPIIVALAWALRRPFETFPLIGPRTLAEARTSLAALDVELSDREVRRLDLEE